MIAWILATLLTVAGLEEPPTRVIVQLGHDHFVNGTVIERTPDELTIRRNDGTEVTYDLTTVMGVINLLDASAPIEVSVHLRDGRTIRGTLLGDDWAEVRLRVKDVDVRYPRSKVAAVIPKPDFDALFVQARARVGDDDEHGRIELARWLMAHSRWARAAVELESIVERFNSPEAQGLLRRARAQAALLTPPSTPPGASPAETPPDTPVPPSPAPADDAASNPPPAASRLALPDERLVHYVRLMELDPLRPPPVQVSQATRHRLHQGWGGNRLLPETDAALQTLLAMPDADVMRLMFDLRARPLYGEIDVVKPPPSLQTFTNQVHDRWLTTRCGTRACHGGPDGGRFRLLRRTTVDDRLRTANLLQLQRTRIGDRGLIDWSNPGRSLLALHALPRDRVAPEDAHPVVPGWRPVLNKEGHEALLGWIRSMRQPRPEIDWHPRPLQPPVEPSSG